MEHWRGQDQGRYVHRREALELWNQWFRLCLKAPVRQRGGQLLSGLNLLCSGIVVNECAERETIAKQGGGGV